MTDKNEPAFGAWQPIETAPKDGRNIFIFIPQEFNTGIYTAWWSRDHWCSIDSSWIGRDLPTHWMPLPNPPLKESEGV